MVIYTKAAVKTRYFKDVKTMFDIIVVGASIVDILVRPMDVVPECESFPVEHIGMATGGDAINEATIIARLGKKVSLVSKIGDDPAGAFILDHCRRNGVNTDDFVKQKGLDTGVNIVMVDSRGERRFITNKNGSLRKQTLEDVPFDILKKAKIFSFASMFVSPYFDVNAMEKLFSEAKKAGCTVCADTTKRKNGETPRSLSAALRYVDYIFPNFDEAALLTGETDIDKIADAFLDNGVGCAVIKTGRRGCLIKTANERLEVPAYEGTVCTDTTGAGDNFAAGFLYALSEGMTLYDCGRFANATASVAIESIGATTGVTSAAQVRERFEKIS